MADAGDDLNGARLNIGMRQDAHVEGTPIGVSVHLTGDGLLASCEDPPQYRENTVSPTIMMTRSVVHIVSKSKMAAT